MPDPDGPMSATNSPGRDLEGDAAQRVDGRGPEPVALLEVARLEDRGECQHAGSVAAPMNAGSAAEVEPGHVADDCLDQTRWRRWIDRRAGRLEPPSAGELAGQRRVTGVAPSPVPRSRPGPGGSVGSRRHRPDRGRDGCRLRRRLGRCLCGRGFGVGRLGRGLRGRLGCSTSCRTCRRTAPSTSSCRWPTCRRRCRRRPSFLPRILLAVTGRLHEHPMDRLVATSSG